MIFENSIQPTDEYDPFVGGRYPVGVRTNQALDSARDRVFPCEIWYPEARTGTYPLIIYSHSSGGNRRSASFLCSHLCSHGYVVAALDHSELVAKELARNAAEAAEQKSARVQAMIASRVPDIRFLLDYLLNGATLNPEVTIDSARIGLAGHSFGGWTVLAATAEDSRIGAVVAMAPGGSSDPKPGILPLTLTFNWGRNVPTLYLAAENDISIPLDRMYELFGRAPETKQMIVLRRADHLHFMDNVEQQHEAVRAMPFTGELAWINKEMRPIAELCSGDEAHLFTRGLALSHMDATLRHNEAARRLLAGDIEFELAKRGVQARR
jgi:dienelactone hydrolase